MPKKRRNTLKIKTLIVVLVALMIGAGSYFALTQFENFLINTFYLTDEKSDERVQYYVDCFSQYVTDNKVKSSNLSAIRNWCKGQKYVNISLYKDGIPFYETDGTFGEIYNSDDYLDGEYYGQLYPINFSDGVGYIGIIEYSEATFYNIGIYVALAVSAIIIILIILLFNQKIIRKAIRLSGEVKEVCYGNLNKEINLKGDDELSDLGNDVNEMRMSIIRHYEKEQEALNANNELLTSISHDIRTPLTSLIGYSEMMSDPACTNIDEMKRYAEICCDKAYRLKDLTDTMFKYFLVYGKSDVEFDIQKYDATELLEQIIGEYIVGMRDKGYIIKDDIRKDDCKIYTDAKMLKRVFDNVFSNAEKYADKEKDISISVIPSGNEISVSVINYIDRNEKTLESTKIGLKTSEKIMEELGGNFKTSSDRKTFTAEVIVPKAVN
jgi:signal transduction histidine kinase